MKGNSRQGAPKKLTNKTSQTLGEGMIEPALRTWTWLRVVVALMVLRTGFAHAAGDAAWPVVTEPEAGELAWIPGVCRSEARVPAAGAPALRVEVEPRA